MDSMLGIHRKSESNLKRPDAEETSASNPPATRKSGRLLGPPVVENNPPRRTFSLLRLRNISDPSLGHKARKYEQKNHHPPLPNPPSIIRTSPSLEVRSHTPSRGYFRTKSADNSHTIPPSTAPSSRASFSRIREGASHSNSPMRMSRVTFDEPQRPGVIASEPSMSHPPPYDDHGNTLSIPAPRLSESSRSTASSGEQIAFTTTTTHTVSTTTTFWKIPRRKKTPQHLFPLPPKVDKEVTHTTHTHVGPELMLRPELESTSSSTVMTPSGTSVVDRSQNASSTLAASTLGLAGPGTPLIRSNSTASSRSLRSNPASLKQKAGLSRGRSVTLGAMEGSIGRNSISGLFNLCLRRESEPGAVGDLSRGPSPQPYRTGTISNSVVDSKERLMIPERRNEDTPQMFLARMEKAVSKSVLASLLARSDDTFHVAVLKAYMATFDFRDDPMDMALRKLLMEAELPRETQQIDRVVQAFAERYHECNPYIYTSPEQAYFIAFSLLILHTDVFNKNNRHKMQKADYVKNTQGEGVTIDILECFYANITYTPFIHVEDDFDINGEKIVPQRPKRGLFGRGNSDGKRNISIKEPVDPYALIMEQRLDLLRPTLKDVIEIEDPYSYLGTANRLDISGLHQSFFRYAVLQIVSPRSRPDAFLSPSTVANPQDADPGVVDIKITKIGILWRKDTKKKKMRDPWQEWGSMLTGSQLYFFKNVGWIKNLMGQLEQHQKAGNCGTPVVFTPPLNTFKPDALVSTDDAVALLDHTYKKHKHAFAFIRHGGVQEYFLAESEAEMNDWLAKLNYAATFRTAGVRMRGVVGGNYEGQRVPVIRRLGDSPAARVIDSPSGEVSILRGGIDQQLAADISNARRQIVEQKILDSEERLVSANKQLDTYLRNARHLSILTPIQVKTREHVIFAATALAAKLQWVRMDMWKLKCHRDILALDMEEEKKVMKEHARKPAIDSVARRPSKCSAHSGRDGDLGADMQETLTPTPDMLDTSNDNIEPVPSLDLPEPIAHDNWDLPFLTIDSKPRGSISSSVQRPQSSASLAPVNETSAGTDSPSNRTSLSIQSTVKSEDDIELDLEKAPDTEKGKSKELGSLPKLRRGLQKTLREAHVPGHKSKKSRDMSAEIANGAEKNGGAQEEGLARTTGSFTVHGKKASVITFGSEWNSISPEERIRRHKASLSPEPGAEHKSSLLGDSTSLTTLSRQNSELK
ncbi:hypothetical protein L211DRAFT_854097 [Terfezia boudieri ATCC MYA-4762]|uniref:Uncharacterized protein n=1 Tax=Terfezia boudieri ATCC MYA-4762 TaxID=1051890 RepID=A0A3N4L6I6_9PEZI|nr:hypothetical protein L211DRAFT_854097 [Terfezia boudieri ATCC MYA-4762]